MRRAGDSNLYWGDEWMTTATETKERPIFLNGDEVRSILDGHKTQLRKPVPTDRHERIDGFFPGEPGHWVATDENGGELFQCPFGTTGDRLWVRETWRCVAWPGDSDDFREVIQYKDGVKREIGHEGDHTLEFDNWCETIAQKGAGDLKKAGFRFDRFGRLLNEHSYDYGNPPIKWCPPIYMPRWASRITLEVTDVRVQQDADTWFWVVEFRRIEPPNGGAVVG